MHLVEGFAELLVQVRAATPHEWVAWQMTELLARWAPEVHAATLDKAIAQYVKRHWRAALISLANIHGLVGRQHVRTRERRRPTLPDAIANALADVARELDPRYSASAITVLRRRAPETFDRIIGPLVDGDASVAILPDVHRWMHRHRQDLLTPYLGDRKVRGQWATGTSAWILPFTDDFFRWTPAQAEQFALSLEKIVGDRERDVPAVQHALQIWPRIEDASMERLLTLELLQRASGLRLVDRAKTLLAACRDRMRSPYDEEVRAAVTAVLGRSTKADMPALELAFDGLRADPRALHVAAAALCAHGVHTRDSWRLAARALEQAAMRDPRWGVLAIQAAGAPRRPRELVAAIVGAAGRDALDLDATLAATDAIRSLRDEDLDPVILELAASPHPAVRRVAVSALAHGARPGRGWTADRLVLLGRLRADPVPAVAGAAARLWPPREQDPGT